MKLIKIMICSILFMSLYLESTADNTYICPPEDDGWSDFVFDKNYFLMPIDELA